MIFLVGGARPNFMKIAPISRAMEKYGLEHQIVHTGQHYDHSMSQIFFDELDLKEPAFELGVGSGPHGAQTGKIMELFEKLCIDEKPDLIFTVGDVNSTLAAALVGAKLHIPVAHQEAGCRSYDRKMPEEINRIVVDSISDYLFPIAIEDFAQLIKEGVEQSKICLAGDPMIDNLKYCLGKIGDDPVGEPYILVTMHRPATVDNSHTLIRMLEAIRDLSKIVHVIFPMHPRTDLMVETFGLWSYLTETTVLKPLGFLDFLTYLKNSTLVITDSGGIQVETSVLNIPCLTTRYNTEEDFTVNEGTNILVGNKNPIKIVELATKILQGENVKKSDFNELLSVLLDGRSSERMVEFLINRTK